jgi:hypothetical protein
MGHPTHTAISSPTIRDVAPLVRRIPGAAKSGIDRATFIASLHAVADYFAEHPEIPTPHDVVMTHRTTIVDEQDDATRVSAVTRWGFANDAKIGTVARIGDVFPFHQAVVATLPLIENDGSRMVYRRAAQVRPGGTR